MERRLGNMNPVSETRMDRRTFLRCLGRAATATILAGCGVEGEEVEQELSAGDIANLSVEQTVAARSDAELRERLADISENLRRSAFSVFIEFNNNPEKGMRGSGTVMERVGDKLVFLTAEHVVRNTYPKNPTSLVLERREIEPMKITQNFFRDNVKISTHQRKDVAVIAFKAQPDVVVSSFLGERKFWFDEDEFGNSLIEGQLYQSLSFPTAARENNYLFPAVYELSFQNGNANIDNVGRYAVVGYHAASKSSGAGVSGENGFLGIITHADSNERIFITPVTSTDYELLKLDALSKFE